MLKLIKVILGFKYILFKYILVNGIVCCDQLRPSVCSYVIRYLKCSNLDQLLNNNLACVFYGFPHLINLWSCSVDFPDFFEYFNFTFNLSSAWDPIWHPRPHFPIFASYGDTGGAYSPYFTSSYFLRYQ